MVLPQIDLSEICGEYAPVVKRGWSELDKLKERKKLLKWWQIFKKREINIQISIITSELFSIGLDVAFKDLEKMGIVKEVKL